MNRTIRFGEPYVLPLPKEKLPPGDLLVPHADNRHRRSDNFQIYIANHVLLEILQQLKENMRVESGGVLVGHPFQDLDNLSTVFIIIAAAVRQDTSNRSVGHFTVNPQDIAITREEVERQYPGLAVVGWYHSHPGHGIFLSGQDMQIVRSLYNASWHVALVVDPQRQEMAFFRSDGIRVPGWLLLKDVHTVWPSGPASLRTIALFNQWQEAKEQNDSNRAVKLLQQLKKCVLNEPDLRHWQSQGKYQDIPLNTENTPVPQIGITYANEMVAGDSPIFPASDSTADRILRAAEDSYGEGNFESAEHYLRMLHDNHPEFKREEREKLKKDIAEQRSSQQRKKIWLSD